MLYLSSALQANPAYSPAAGRLSAAFDCLNIKYQYIGHAKDIWLRDFMPIKTAAGKYISFRYEPSYLAHAPELRTDYKADVAPHLSLSVVDSAINLDGGNVVFSPSGRRAVISDRVFAENPSCAPAALVREVESLLEAQVIIIPSLKSDMTGHADGMVRFVDEHTVLGNQTAAKNGLEQKIKRILNRYGIETVDFPYVPARGISAVGCYLNFFETETHLFLPVFGIDRDAEAIAAANTFFSKKTVVPVPISEIAEDGGGLNCITWEA